ncbi:hypothetical protein I545_6617 [Mycobacterium kansasii 662]|uniref:Uncharacterized protein n=1 Tax=Mycobacterium kansasii 662 TaxID=1299326 RepID=X7Y5X5_MYCKA|nr:hypothetical protein I545_6617 [Mycobacterium kansasii 662]
MLQGVLKLVWLVNLSEYATNRGTFYYGEKYGVAAKPFNGAVHVGLSGSGTTAW